MSIMKFAEPLDESEAADRFEVLEDRDTRVLVRSIVYLLDWSIRPTYVYDKSELVPADPT
jgi:hypothetical protein